MEIVLNVIGISPNISNISKDVNANKKEKR